MLTMVYCCKCGEPIGLFLISVLNVEELCEECF